MPRNTRSSPGTDAEQVVPQKNAMEGRKRPRDETKQEDSGNKARNTSTKADPPAATKSKAGSKDSAPNRALGAFSAHLAPKQALDAQGVEQQASSGPSWSKDDLMKLMDAVRAECSGSLTLSSEPSSGGDPGYIDR
jgi:hypothetical protein